MIGFSTDKIGTIGFPHAKIMNQHTYLSLYTKMNLKWITDIKVKWKIIKHTEKHMKENIRDLRIYEDKLKIIKIKNLAL